MKDPLQAEKTAYEILGVEHGAGDSAIDLAFKRAIADAGAKGQDPGPLVVARNALKRPAERARQDLLQYAAGATSLSPSPLSDPGCLLPDRRADTAAAWEANLRDKYPDTESEHSLAVLWYWWSLQQEAELRRAAETAGPDAQRDAGPGGAETPARKMLLEAWRRTIAYWTMLANVPGFWRSWAGLDGDLVREVTHALVKSLGDRLHQSEQLFKQVGRSDLSDAYAQLKLDLSRETSAAAAWARADLGPEFPEAAAPCGPLALQQLGRLDAIRARLSSASFREAHLLRELLSDLWPVYMALRDKAPDAALQAIARLPLEQSASAEVSKLRARALLLKGQEQANINDFDGALRSWEAGLGAAGDEGIGAEIRSTVVEACRARANALGTPGRDEAIALLGKAVALVHDAGMTQTLSLLSLERGIGRINRYLERRGRGEDLAVGEAQSVRDAAKDISHAAKLDPSSSRAAQQAEVAEQVVRGLVLAECAAKNPRLKAILSKVERTAQREEFDEAIGLLDEALGLGIGEAQDGLRQRLAVCLNSRALKNTNEAEKEADRSTPSFLKAASSFADSLPVFRPRCAVCSTLVFSDSCTWRKGDKVALLCPGCAAKAQAEEAMKKAAVSKLLLDALADLRDAVELDQHNQAAKENKRQLERMLSDAGIPAVPRRPRRYAQHIKAVRQRPEAPAWARPAAASVTAEATKAEAASGGQAQPVRPQPRASGALRLLSLVLLPLLLIFGSVAWTARSTVLNPPFYARALAEAGILDSLSELASPDLAAFYWGGTVPEKSRPQFEGLISDALAAALPPAWVGPRITEAAAAALEYVRGSDSTFEFTLDVLKPKSEALAVLSKSKLAWDLVRRVRTPVSRLPVQYRITTDTLLELQAWLDEARSLVGVLDPALPLGIGFVFFVCLLGLLLAGGARQGGFGWLGGGFVVGGLAVLGLAQLLGAQSITGVTNLPLEETTVPHVIGVALSVLSDAVVGCLGQAGLGLLLGGAGACAMGWMLRSPSPAALAAADRAPVQSRAAGPSAEGAGVPSEPAGAAPMGAGASKGGAAGASKRAGAPPKGAGASTPATGRSATTEAWVPRVTDACIRCGACVAACPEVFIMGPDRAHVMDWVLKKTLRKGDGSLEARIREAVEVCPIEAIVV